MARQPQPPPPANKMPEHKDSAILLHPLHGQVSLDEYQFPEDRTPPQKRPPGAGIDIASDAMPDEGMLEVYDDDDDIRERRPGTPETHPKGRK